jgi:hypothetical protein
MLSSPEPRDARAERSSLDPPALDAASPYDHLEDPPGLSSITTVGRFATVDEAQIATDELLRECPR